MFGEAWLILLIKAIYRSIKGAKQSLTPKPHPIMKGSQGTPVAAYVDTSKAAVTLKAGANQCHTIGKANCFFCFVAACSLSCSDLIASSVAARYECSSCSLTIASNSCIFKGSSLI